MGSAIVFLAKTEQPIEGVARTRRRKKEVALTIERIVTVLLVAALMAVMMVATVMPAFAKKNTETPPNCEDGNNNAFYKPGGDKRDEQATNSLDKNSFGTTKKFDTYKNPHAAYCEE